MEKPTARIDRGKLAFLAIVALCAAAIAALLAELPMSWRTAAILWLLVGLPLTVAVLRVWRGYVTLQLEAMARAPQQRPSVATTQGVGGRERRELRVVEAAKGEHGRRML